MQDSAFHHLIDKQLNELEQQLDLYEGHADIDYELQSGILTLSFEDGSKIIINRQEPLHQLWLATKFDGYHCEYSEEKQAWFCNRTGRAFLEILSDATSKQAKDTIVFK